MTKAKLPAFVTPVVGSYYRLADKGISSNLKKCIVQVTSISNVKNKPLAYLCSTSINNTKSLALSLADFTGATRLEKNNPSVKMLFNEPKAEIIPNVVAKELNIPKLLKAKDSSDLNKLKNLQDIRDNLLAGSFYKLSKECKHVLKRWGSNLHTVYVIAIDYDEASKVRQVEVKPAVKNNGSVIYLDFEDFIDAKFVETEQEREQESVLEDTLYVLPNLTVIYVKSVDKTSNTALCYVAAMHEDTVIKTLPLVSFATASTLEQPTLKATLISDIETSKAKTYDDIKHSVLYRINDGQDVYVKTINMETEQAFCYWLDMHANLHKANISLNSFIDAKLVDNQDLLDKLKGLADMPSADERADAEEKEYRKDLKGRIKSKKKNKKHLFKRVLVKDSQGFQLQFSDVPLLGLFAFDKKLYLKVGKLHVIRLEPTQLMFTNEGEYYLDINYTQQQTFDLEKEILLDTTVVKTIFK